MTNIDTTSPELSNRRCSNCRLFEELEYTEEYGVVGYCRRRAPVPFVGGVILRDSLFRREDANSASWPVVRENDWCGEHVANVLELQEDVDAGL